jgi:hypothetical protein
VNWIPSKFWFFVLETIISLATHQRASPNNVGCKFLSTKSRRIDIIESIIEWNWIDAHTKKAEMLITLFIWHSSYSFFCLSYTVYTHKNYKRRRYHLLLAYYHFVGCEGDNGNIFSFKYTYLRLLLFNSHITNVRVLLLYFFYLTTRTLTKDGCAGIYSYFAFFFQK